MCTHLNLIFTLFFHTSDSILSAQPESQRHQDTAREALATVMRGGIDLHVHSPKFILHATHPSRSRERNPGRKHKGIRASGYCNEKRNRFCMCTHLNLISTLFFHTSVSIQRAQTRKHKGFWASGYSIMRSRIDLHVHSPKFNLHTVLPHIRLDPESAQPESQRHQDTAWEALATIMRSGIDLHVHSPKFNLHATHPS